MFALLDALSTAHIKKHPPPSPTFSAGLSPTYATDDVSWGDDNVCQCSKTMCLLRTLHIEGLPLNMSAAGVSEVMSTYGQVQYAEAAPEVVKDAQGLPLGRKVHCYVVFNDHAGACAARRALQPKTTDASPVSIGAGRDQGALRVRFAKLQNLVPSCTPSFRAFVAGQWAQVASLAKASPGEFKKPACLVNALFVSKLHQHITNVRLNSLFGKYGPMIACEVQYHSDGRSAGHGVVIYETIDDAERALLGTNGYRLEGRQMEVTPLRLKKLPSKLEHLKNRIKRQPLPGGSDLSSEDGSMSGCGGLPSPLPSPLASPPGHAMLPPMLHGGVAPAGMYAAGFVPPPPPHHPHHQPHPYEQLAAVQLQQALAAGMTAGASMRGAPLQGLPPSMQGFVLPNGMVVPHPAGTLPPGLDLSFL